jgi:hypothetical protein
VPSNASLSDEADVFLEARGEGENDLRRNAMVSGKNSDIYSTYIEHLLTKAVLLRVLEYYDGILILTTNRMRSFDIAVQSRIREFSPRLFHGTGSLLQYIKLSIRRSGHKV